MVVALDGIFGKGKGLEPMSTAAAFDKVVEEVELLLLYELQEKGVL